MNMNVSSSAAMISNSLSRILLQALISLLIVVIGAVDPNPGAVRIRHQSKHVPGR